MQPLVLRAPAPRSGGASPRIRTRIAPGWVLPDQRTRTQELALLRVTGAFKLLHSCPTHLVPQQANEGDALASPGAAMAVPSPAWGTELGSAQISLW